MKLTETGKIRIFILDIHEVHKLKSFSLWLQNKFQHHWKSPARLLLPVYGLAKPPLFVDSALSSYAGKKFLRPHPFDIFISNSEAFLFPPFPGNNEANQFRINSIWHGQPP